MIIPSGLELGGPGLWAVRGRGYPGTKKEASMMAPKGAMVAVWGLGM
jgi:hypothetical protein